MKKNLLNRAIEIFGEKVFTIFSKTYVFFKYNIINSIIGLFVNKSKIFEIDGLKFKFPLSPLSWYGLGFKNYEKVERNFVKKYVHPDDVVLELGASVGVISCTTNKNLGFNKSHVVVEPNPFVLKFLKINRDLNSCKFIIEDCIVSNNKKEIDFFVSPNYIASSMFNINDANSTEKIKVKCKSITELSNEHHLTFNTLIMDIEGQELEVLRDIDLRPFKKLIIEFHPDILTVEEFNKCLKIIKDNNFNLQEKEESVQVWMK